MEDHPYLTPAWDDIRITRISLVNAGNLCASPLWAATGVRNLDSLTFCTVGMSPDEARARLDHWLDAPIKSESLSDEQYYESEEFNAYAR